LKLIPTRDAQRQGNDLRSIIAGPRSRPISTGKLYTEDSCPPVLGRNRLWSKADQHMVFDYFTVTLRDWTDAAVAALNRACSKG